MKKGDIPTYEELLFPLLEYAKDGREVSLNDVEKHLAEKIELPEEKRKMKKPSGKEAIFVNRIFWARLYLKRAGLISYTDKESHYKITDDGKKYVKNNTTIDVKSLMKFEPFKKWQDEIKYSKKITRQREKISRTPPEYQRVVIFMDALGTKGIMKKKNQDEVSEVLRIWREFVENMRSAVNIELCILGEVSFDTFSDTIIITVRVNEKKYPLYKISEFLRSFIIESMKIERPIRGCISVGQIIKDDKIFLGEAIDEAVDYHNLSQQWIGISACPSAYYEIEKLYQENREETKSYFQKYDIPLKTSIEQGAWAVNWPRIENQKDEVRRTLDKNLETKTGIQNSLKWINTANFFDYVINDLMSFKR